jgi:hypothetical protein
MAFIALCLAPIKQNKTLSNKEQRSNFLHIFAVIIWTKHVKGFNFYTSTYGCKNKKINWYNHVYIPIPNVFSRQPSILQAAISGSTTAVYRSA